MKSCLALLVLIFISLFLIACSSPPASPPMPLTFIHVLPTYQEVVSFDDSALPVPSLLLVSQKLQTPNPQATDHKLQTSNRKPLSDAGLPCAETYQCKGFCLALERNAVLGY